MVEFHGYYFEDLSVGMSAASARTVTEADIALYGGISGDMNPLHHNQEFAKTTIFGECISPGMLTAGLISAVIGTKLPGPGSIYLSQSLRFRAPVRVGDTVVARVSVSEVVPGKRRATLATVCTVGEQVVLEGEALILVPSRESQEEIPVAASASRA